jgi:5,10-methylene-tetrahydrofolate dehydrogenase/methenyl tetrahydrofolate cyclohydrolase
MIRVGEDPASVSYVTGKEQACEEIGIWSQTYVLTENAPEAELLAKVEEMNKAEHVDGILVQLPLPKLSSTLLKMSTDSTPSMWARCSSAILISCPALLTVRWS